MTHTDKMDAAEWAAIRLFNDFAEGMRRGCEIQVDTFEAEIARCIAEGIRLPGNHQQILAYLRAGDISLCRALWSVIDDDRRPDFKAFKRDFFRSTPIDLGANLNKITMFAGETL